MLPLPEDIAHLLRPMSTGEAWLTKDGSVRLSNVRSGELSACQVEFEDPQNVGNGLRSDIIIDRFDAWADQIVGKPDHHQVDCEIEGFEYARSVDVETDDATLIRAAMFWKAELDYILFAAADMPAGSKPGDCI
ncbi:MAG: hypothetical protein AAF401_00930 [Pseudomonadota bacterium]